MSSDVHSTESLEIAATKIQAAWRHYQSRKKTGKTERVRHCQRDNEVSLEKCDGATFKEEAFYIQLEKYRHRRLLIQQKLHFLSHLPSNEVEEFVTKEKENAVIKIQANWRGFLTRKNFRREKDILLRNKSALKIQKWFRKQLFQRQIGKLKLQYLRQPSLSQERLSFLQSQIDEYQQQHCNINLTTDEQRILHRTVQQKLSKFYSSQAQIRDRDARQKIILQQLETHFDALTNKTKIIPYSSPSKLIQTKAKQLHEITLENLTKPWRKYSIN